MDRQVANRLIHELIRTGRHATLEEIEQIVESMATASFDPRPVRVRVEERGASYQGHTLGSRSDSLMYHLIKRVVIERQWVSGTTANEYLEDLRRAVRDPAARLCVYDRRGGPVAATVTATHLVLPPERLGEGALLNLLVVYSADRGIIVSGYQFSSLARTGIPQEARWLK